MGSNGQPQRCETNVLVTNPPSPYFLCWNLVFILLLILKYCFLPQFESLHSLTHDRLAYIFSDFVLLCKKNDHTLHKALQDQIISCKKLKIRICPHRRGMREGLYTK